MNQPVDYEQAVLILGEAAKTGLRPSELPASCRPSSVTEALAIQEKLLAYLHADITGWKVTTNESGISLWGAIFATDCFSSPAQITGYRWEPLGIEGEIAFYFERDLPRRADLYTRSEIENVLVAFPAIEIISSRFANYRHAPFLDRLADRMSNGGIVLGTPCPDWQSMDLSQLRVTLNINGTEKLNQIGGHSRIDPLLPAIDFIHARQAEKTFRARQFITTGTFTGLVFGKPGEHVTIDFQGFGTVSMTIG